MRFLFCFADASTWRSSETRPSVSPQSHRRSTTSCSQKCEPISSSPNTTTCSVRLLIGRSRARNASGAELVSFGNSAFFNGLAGNCGEKTRPYSCGYDDISRPLIVRDTVITWDGWIDWLISVEDWDIFPFNFSNELSMIMFSFFVSSVYSLYHWLLWYSSKMAGAS